MGTAL